MKTLASPILSLFLASSIMAAPVIGEDIPPFGTQGVWANEASLELRLDQMRDAGIRVARMDLCWWNLCEREPGVYNWTAPDYPGYENWNTDRLIEEMHARDIEPYAILCYGNALYDEEKGPFTAEGRAAFARYCADAATRYRNSIFIWEIWNEPNLDEYWSGGTDPTEYALMAIEAAQAIRAANPDAIIVGPALSWLNIADGMLDQWYHWLEVCGEHGLYDLVDAVSIHPYRVGIMPESINPELERIRAIIAKHTDNDVAIWTGEWGYNTLWTEVDEIEQAKYLPRQFLNNMSQGVEMSIWFSFKHMAGEGWGMMTEDWQPRPVVRAMRTISEVLALPLRLVDEPGFVEVTGAPESLRVEVFESGENRRVVALWLAENADTDFEPVLCEVKLNVSDSARVTARDGLTGEILSFVGGSGLNLSDAVTYLIIEE